MRNKSQYEQITEIYNREQGTHIVLREDENGSMTPVIELDTQEVVFNPRFQTLLTLFNIATLHKQEGSKAIHHFLLYHLAIRKNMYGKAEELLDLLNRDIDDLYEIVRKEDIRFCEIVVDAEKVKREESAYKKIPVITNFTDEDGNDRMKETVQANYRRIKEEVKQIVQEELERIKNDPVLCKLLPDNETV